MVSIFSVGINKFVQQVPNALENSENGLTPIIRSVLKSLLDELKRVTFSFDKLTKEIEVLTKRNDVCKRLLKIPGIGAISSSILYAKFGQGDGFKKG